MDPKHFMKGMAQSATPLLLFAALLVPYDWFNQHYVIEWFGCGCPKVDMETGQMIEAGFNANSFTLLFWLFVSLCATVLSAFLSRRYFRQRPWMCAVCTAAVFCASLFLSFHLSQLMMWK